MVRSVLRLSPDDFKSIVGLLPKNKEKPKLSNLEREKLNELKDVLEFFEEFTNHLQSDSITISKVYPAVSGLKVFLLAFFNENLFFDLKIFEFLVSFTSVV